MGLFDKLKKPQDHKFPPKAVPLDENREKGSLQRSIF